jgi:hypothetical protein
VLNNQPQEVHKQKVTILEIQAVHILDEYSDRERRKANIIIIRNLPGSKIL